MFPQITEQDIFKLSTIQLVPLGTIFVGEQGRKRYRYVQFGGTATINSGLLLVAPAAPANSTGLALNATNLTANLAIGSKQVIITNGATAVTLNQFQEGTLEILGSGGFESYRIAGNSADSVGAAAITVTLQEALRNTLVVGTNTVNLRQNPALNPAASLTAAEAVGVTIQPVPNTASVTNFGWVQTGGDAVVQATTATKGQALTQDGAGTAGFFMNVAAATTPTLAQAQESAVNSTATVNLNIA